MLSVGHLDPAHTGQNSTQFSATYLVAPATRESTAPTNDKINNLIARGDQGWIDAEVNGFRLDD
jgi:hypothetical protein